MIQRATSHKSLTDWTRINALNDEDIDFLDIPKVTPAMFAKGVVPKGPKTVMWKQHIKLSIDSDVVA